MTLLPHEAVWSLTTAVIGSRALHVVAELGVADHLDHAPTDVATLASRCGGHPGALDRVLRLLAAHGVFELIDGGFAHTEASQLLRSDHPRSMRAFPRMFGLPSFTAALGQLEESVRTGGTAFEHVDPRGMWAYLADHAEEAAVFAQAMQAKAEADIAAVLGAYDFDRFATVADIGGGRGHLLAAILDAVPSARGVLFDLPPVIESVDVASDRLALHAGDFFVDPLPKADAYLLMEVIHDWDDERAGAILAAIRAAAPGGASVLIIEGIVPEGRPDPRVHTLDVVMLAMTGGQERSATALHALLEANGFRPRPVIRTDGAMQVVQGVAV